MKENHKKIDIRMLFLITTPKRARKAADLFRAGNVPVQYCARAKGTASSEMMHLLGLGDDEKTILMSMMPRVFADKMLLKLKKQLQLGGTNSGVAFTVPMSGGSRHMIRLIEMQQEEAGTDLGRSDRDMEESRYNMIIAIVDQGFSEEVMEAARPAGATGGSVLHCRRIGNEETMQFWGIRVQQEREIVVILARKDEKVAIMKSISQACGMQTEAHGVVVSLPVDSVAGID